MLPKFEYRINTSDYIIVYWKSTLIIFSEAPDSCGVLFHGSGHGFGCGCGSEGLAGCDWNTHSQGW